MVDETAIAVHGGSLPARSPVVTRDDVELIKRTVAQGATDAELKLFMHDCARQGVHPLDRLIHFTKRGGKYTPITSIDFMRSRAADTGEYCGNDDPVYFYADGRVGPSPLAATATVYRLVAGSRYPFTATARFAEYKPSEANNADVMWRRMPHVMIGKCAEALALRKAFPRQLSGLYAREEMEAADTFDATGGAVDDPPGPSSWADKPSAASSPVAETLRQALRETAPATRPAPPSPFPPLDPVNRTARDDRARSTPPVVDAPPPSPTANGAPPVAVRIVAVDPPPAGSKARGFIRHSGGVDPNPIAFYADKVEQAAHYAQSAGVAVVLDVERRLMQEPNTPYVRSLIETLNAPATASPPPVDDIPF